MFAVPASERDPVAVYKLYAAKKRLSEMNHDKAPFYLAVNTCKNQDSSKPWFKKSAVGLHKLNCLMKTMAEKAGFGPIVKNHSGRKTITKLYTFVLCRVLRFCTCLNILIEATNLYYYLKYHFKIDFLIFLLTNEKGCKH